jgi:hypothetical protein
MAVASIVLSAKLLNQPMNRGAGWCNPFAKTKKEAFGSANSGGISYWKMA